MVFTQWKTYVNDFVTSTDVRILSLDNRAES